MAKVVIDPGHGGTSNIGGSSWNNATGPNGTLEKDLTLLVGKAAQKALSSASIVVVMTRDKDENLGIRARAEKAKSINADAFVSIHFNAARSDRPPAQGTETWVESAATKKSRQFASEIQKSVQFVTGYRDRGVKYGNVSGVIRNRNHSKRTAHCLVEVSFIDRQPADEKRLQDPKYIAEIGGAISNGVRQYLRRRGLLAEPLDIDEAFALQEPEDAATAAELGFLDEAGNFVEPMTDAPISSDMNPQTQSKIVTLVNKNISSTSADARLKMAQMIVDFEARRDSRGRLQVYKLPSGDGGGRYEVAGINERYHKEICDQLVRLIKSGKHKRAEKIAVDFVGSYTDTVLSWCQVTAIESYLRDCAFNRGPGGAAWILQDAVRVKRDRVVGPNTRQAVARAEKKPRKLLKRLRKSREGYERKVVGRDERSKFWRGLMNRWNKAHDFALSFLTEELPHPNPWLVELPDLRNTFPLEKDAGFLAKAGLSDRTSDERVLRKLAKKHDLETPVERMIDLRNDRYPDSRPRYWGVVNFQLHSAKPRLFVLDVITKSTKSYLCSHGIGSEGRRDDGIADFFSNEKGSKASSLGIYRCAETYQSRKNGYSMRLDGLEADNSNARSRYIVMHGADYVSRKHIKKYGRIGRSEGCPAVARKHTSTVINQLKLGSLLIHWRAP